jgi:hypothetical protein
VFTLLTEHRIKAKCLESLIELGANDVPKLLAVHPKWLMITIADILTAYLDQMWYRSPHILHC